MVNIAIMAKHTPITRTAACEPKKISTIILRVNMLIAGSTPAGFQSGLNFLK
jgi:hypothetical protein